MAKKTSIALFKDCQVGPDSLDSCCDFLRPIENFTKYPWFIYWYEIGSYDGTGMAIAVTNDDVVACYDLGHCSCYGPLDSSNQPVYYPLNEFLTFDVYDPTIKGRKRVADDYDFDRWILIIRKLKSLLATVQVQTSPKKRKLII
jgi:hypothetical protein